MSQPESKRIDVAVGIVVREDRVLVCRRKFGGILGGYHEFPGGKIEAGESIHQCLIRELREELDIEVAVLDPLGTIVHRYPHAIVTLHPFICELKSGEPTPIACASVDWVLPEHLRQHTFPPANESLLDEVIARLVPTSEGST